MYNNLDASLDTTLFSQYSQSQDELMCVNCVCFVFVVFSADRYVTNFTQCVCI